MNLFKLLSTVSIFTLFSRITGFFRSILIAFFLGASATTDSLFVAIRISNFLRKILAEGAFSGCFIPIFQDVLTKNGKDAAVKMGQKVYSLLFFLTSLISVVIIIFYPIILKIFAPGFTDERYALGINLGRICFPFIISTCLVALISGILNTIGKFGLPAFLQVFVNIGSIVAMTIAYYFHFDYAYSIAFGFLVTGIIQVIVIQKYAAKFGFKFSLTKNFISPEIKQIFKNMVPSVMSSGIWQINLLVDSQVASLLSAGAISYIYYADQIIQLPLSTLGIAIASALVPIFTKNIADKNFTELKLSFNKTLCLSLGIAMPASAAFIFLADPIIIFIAGRGAFGISEVHSVSRTLQIFSLSLPIFILNKILISIFFSFKDTKTPMKSTIINLICNVSSLIIFVPHFDYLGIAISNVIASYVNVFYLYFHRPKQIKILKLSKKIFAKQFTATVILSFSLYYCNLLMNDYFYMSFMKKFLYLFIAIFINIGIYYTLGIIFKFINFNKILKEFKK